MSHHQGKVDVELDRDLEDAPPTAFFACPIVVNGPSHYTVWQFTENGRIDGIEKAVDFCRFHPDKSMKDLLLPKKK